MTEPDETPSRPSARDRLRIVARAADVDAAAGDAAAAAIVEPIAGDDAADVAAPIADTPSGSPRMRRLAARPARIPRIAPHAARTATRARRTWFALLFFPVFAIYVVVDALRGIRDGLARARGVQIESRPPFRRPESMPPVDQRSMADIVAAVERFPFRPANISTSATFFRDNGPDALAALLSPNPQVASLPHLYPPAFRQRLFNGDGGVQLAGMQAMHDHRGPAVVISHGLLMTKNFDAIVQLARRAFEQWGFHVVTLDLRGWGQSAWTTDAPSSAGYHEGRDIVEVCRELKADPRVTSVGAIGYSLGGASTITAAAVSSRSDDRPLDGGAVAVSPPTIIDLALDHISTKPHWRDPYFGLWHLFRAAIRSQVRRHALSPRVRTWTALVEEMSLPYYGTTMEEFTERASVAGFAHEIDQPVLALHATDDFLVPVQHAYALQDATVDNPWVHVMVRDAGAHVAFGAADPSWYFSTLRCWMEYWATPAVVEPEDAPID